MLVAEMLEEQAWKDMGLSLIISNAQVGAKCLAKQAKTYSVLRMALQLDDFTLQIFTRRRSQAALKIVFHVMTNA